MHLHVCMPRLVWNRRDPLAARCERFGAAANVALHQAELRTEQPDDGLRRTRETESPNDGGLHGTRQTDRQPDDGLHGKPHMQQR
jgi:hypothetical protein